MLFFSGYGDHLVLHVLTPSFPTRRSSDLMRHVAVIGSGPAGYYTAEACQKTFGDGVRIDIIDRLPVPFGLIRSGVAPDHQSIKGVSRRYESVALTDNEIGRAHV